MPDDLMAAEERTFAGYCPHDEPVYSRPGKPGEFDTECFRCPADAAFRPPLELESTIERGERLVREFAAAEAIRKEALARRDDRDRVAAQALLEQSLERVIREWEEEDPAGRRVERVSVLGLPEGGGPIVEVVFLPEDD
jgi:hypothetical protein